MRCIHRTNISTNSPWEAANGYSRCVKLERADSTDFFFAGTTAINPDGTIEHEGDAGGQARVILERIGAVLQEHGASLADVVATRMYVTDVAHAQAVGLAHGAVFKDIRPAATLMVVAGLVDPRMLVEIEAHAIASR
ncbi:MAG: RidA family protein [Phycisphaeraceae bacterium]|nr:RidA family protein [Phycisphaeraceae bacterium]